MGTRFFTLLALVGLAGCSVIEPERRPPSGPPGTVLRSSGAMAGAVNSVAARPVATADLWPMDAPAIYAKSAILIDADSGRTLFQKNADSQRQVASTQKLLTGLIIAERGNLDSLVTIRASDAAVEPTNAGIRAGQVYSRRQLLNALIVHSCNDTGAALGRDAAGSIEGFSYLMNSRAQALGAHSSHFVNPHGLPGAQYSTARDMARVAYKAYQQPELRAIMRQQVYLFRFNGGRVSPLKSTNKLLGRVPGVDGMKTGFTNAAGRCLITSAGIDGRHYILVQLGSKTSYIFDDAQRMLMWAATR